MKKFLPIVLAAVLLIALLVVGLTQCKNEPVEPATPDVNPEVSTPTDPDPDVSPVMEEKIKVTFDNDGVSIGFTKIGLDKVTNNIYKRGLTSEQPDEQVVLTELIVTFFDGAPKEDDTPHNPEDELLPDYLDTIQLRFNMLEYNLLSAEDINFKAVLDTLEADEMWEVFPSEMLAELLRRDYGRYDVLVTGFFDRINGDNMMHDTFEFTGEVEFENDCDMNAIKKVPVTLTDAGATIKFNFTDLVTALGVNVENIKDYNGLYFKDFCLGTADSNQDAYMEKVYNVYPNEKIPEELVVEMTYENAAEFNHTIYTKMSEGISGYIWVRMDYKTADDESAMYTFLMVDATAQYTVPEDTDE